MDDMRPTGSRPPIESGDLKENKFDETKDLSLDMIADATVKKLDERHQKVLEQDVSKEDIISGVISKLDERDKAAHSLTVSDPHRSGEGTGEEPKPFIPFGFVISWGFFVIAVVLLIASIKKGT